MNFLVLDRKQIKDNCDSILSTVDHLYERIDQLQKENEYLKSENYKDEELTKMKDDMDLIKEDCSRGFPITESEMKAINEWKENHLKNVHKVRENNDQKICVMNWAIGDMFTYTFNPASIGVFASCRCNTCYRKAYIGYLEGGRNAKLDNYIRKYDAEFKWNDL